MGEILDCLCKGIEFAQSDLAEEAIPDSYDKCERGLTCKSLCIQIHWER